METTSLYAGLIGALLLLLSVRVILLRRMAGVNLGYGNNAALERRIRAQANLSEYAPVALILLALLELSSWPPIVLHLLGVALVTGRILHGWALSFTSSNNAARVAGMAFTLTMITTSAVFCVVDFILAAVST